MTRRDRKTEKKMPNVAYVCCMGRQLHEARQWKRQLTSESVQVLYST